MPEIPSSIGIENFDATYGMGNCAAGDLNIPTNIVANGIALEFYTTWLQFSATSGVVPAEDNVDVQLLFDATDLFDGVYERNIVVSSNDPNNPEVIVPVTLNVTGYPDIDLSESSIDFGSVDPGQEQTLPLVITNSGTKLLEVSNIQITSEYLTLSDTEFSLSPQTSETLYITFYSDEAVDVDQLLILNTNVEGEEIIYMPVSAQVNAYDVVLLVNPAEGGVVDGEGSYLQGEEVTVRAFPSSGDWMFISWTEEGTVVSEENIYTFTIESDITLTANFETVPEISVDPASFEEYVDAGNIITRTLTVSNIGVAGSELDVELFVQDPGLKNRQALNPQIIPGTIKSNEKSSGDKQGSFDISEISRAEENSKAGGRSLLFISTLAEDGANFSAQLQALPNVGYYEEFDARSATPNTEYMQQFDVVFVASTYTFADQVTLGNNLAEYVDLGGNVCIMQSTMSAGGSWALGGTIMTESYSPLNVANYPWESATCENFENHPINSGVNTVSCSGWGYSDLQGNSISLGVYNNGYHVGAVNLEKPIVALNVFPGDSFWSGDLMLMLENTIDYFDVDWLSVDPLEAAIADGGFFEFEVTFDATDLIDGVYEKEIVVLSNDPLNPEVIVPVTLHVTGFPEIELSDNVIDFGTVDAFVENVYPLTITNIGTANLEITGFNMQDNIFGHNGVDMILAPGDSEVVDITLYSETSGLFSDVLSFVSNTEGSETILINIMAEILTYDVTLDENPLEGGSTTGAGTYAQNEVVTLTAVPEVDWIFVSWEEAGVVVSEDIEYTFNIQSDRIITANFAFAPSITVNPEFFDEEMLAGDIMTRTLTLSNNGVAGSELIVSVEVADIEKGLNKNETRADNFSVLYLEANANADAAFKTELQNSAVFETLDIVNVTTQTPDVASMLDYQTVIVSSGGDYLQDPLTLGNNLAEYVDLGGSVIILQATFINVPDIALEGNIMTADYSPVTIEAYTNANTVCNSFVEHSLTTSVNSISTEFYSHATLQGAGVSLGSYDAGYLVAAYNPDKPVMAINLLPSDGLYGGDLIQLIENAVVYYNASWLTVDLEDAVIPEGTPQDFELTFDASDLIEGVYEKNVIITSNDVVNPVVIVPVTLTVTGIPEIVVSPDDIDFGVVTAGQPESVFLDISNAGTGILNITNIATTDPSFVAQATDMTILPNSSDQLEIVFSADFVGNYSDVLSFTTDDPLNENISISMFAEVNAPPVIEVTPESLYETLLVNESSEQIITVSNIGVDTQPLNWSASTFLPTKESINLFNYPEDQGDFNSLAIFSESTAGNEASYNYSRELLDLIDYFPVANGEGEYPVVTDGNFIYTARWNSGEFYKYNLDGTYIESFTIAGASSLRDMTYDGEYFYGSPSSTTIYQMDFDSQTLVGTITAPNAVRGIAYDENNDGFWITNGWDVPLTLIDRDGIIIESISPAIGQISGIAYDDVTEGGPYIWAINHTGNGNDLHQINIDAASIVMTFDVTTTGVIAGGVTSGGLQITDQLIPGKSVFLGTSQNDVVWVLDHADMSWLSVSPASGTLLPGESIDLTVTFNSNGLAEGIYEGEVIVSSDDLVNPEVSVPATLEVEYLYYSIFATAEGNGIISPEGEILVLHKEDQIFNIEADNGYHITDVVVDDVSVGPISAYTFTEVMEGHTINALFDINTYTITASSSAGGSIAPDGETVVDFGSTLDVTITPDEGYYIVDVFVDGVSMGAVNAYTFEDISDDHTIHAEFAICTYEILVEASPYEGGIVTGSGIYEHGELVTLAAYPDIPDYTFVYWTESGVQLSTELTYEFTATEDRHIVGYFRGANEYIVNAVADDPAHGSVEGGGSYEEGQEVSLNAIPNYGFVFDNWSGYAESADNPYVFTMPAEDVDFTANFSIATYEITASVEGNGSIDPEGVIVVEHGDNQTFTITGDIGYHIEDVLVDGVSVGAVDTYTFENIVDNHSIHAVFAIDMFEIIASADANGAIYPSGIIDVEYGSDYTFSIAPDVGYEVSAILIDGVDAGSADTYTFENITESHTIHAEFELTEYLLVVMVNPEGAGNVSIVPDETIFNFGDEVSITAEANDGYAFVKWIDEDAIELSTDASYTFEMPAENYTIIALFDIQPGVNELSLLNVNMYPNPSDGEFTVVSDHLMLEMVVLDMIGKEVYRTNPDSDIANISLPETEPGMYFVRISTIMGTKTIKLQIIK
ncbi:MAG: choice-of-anchor D domain-containing protein [Bacteroidales bacterium]